MLPEETMSVPPSTFKSPPVLVEELFPVKDTLPPLTVSIPASSSFFDSLVEWTIKLPEETVKLAPSISK